MHCSPISEYSYETGGGKLNENEKSMQARVAISEPDDEGFRLYAQRDPHPVFFTLIDEPFRLTLPTEERWTSQTGGAITWNGLFGNQLIMRVIEKSIFIRTYQFLAD